VNTENRRLWLTVEAGACSWGVVPYFLTYSHTTLSLGHRSGFVVSRFLLRSCSYRSLFLVPHGHPLTTVTSMPTIAILIFLDCLALVQRHCDTHNRFLTHLSGLILLSRCIHSYHMFRSTMRSHPEEASQIILAWARRHVFLPFFLSLSLCISFQHRLSVVPSPKS